MNWKIFDALRRNVGPIERDLVENYARSNISRRDFLKRGAILGLSAPFMATVIAACGGDDDTASTEAATDTTAAGGTSAAPTQGGSMRIGIQQGDANSGLDPLNMLDLGTYSVLSQSFEYLVGLGPDGNIGSTGLATEWSPNADGTAWTFKLREGVTWHDGTPFTSADVAATVDRMVVAGAGLAGVVSEGAVETPDELTAVVNLDKANGNLPVLISIYNPQSLITPVDYDDGTTLDARQAGTGPWIFDSHDPTTFTTVFKANDSYWGGRPFLDEVTLIGFGSEGARVSAMQARELDMIQQFGVVDGRSLLNDDSFTVLKPPSANHRQLWFNTQLPEGGPFTDKRVRRAFGFMLDRQQMVDVLFEGFAIVGNDHPVHPTLPFFDPDATPQRPRDVEMAKQLLADAGYEGLSATIEAGDILVSPDMGAIVQQNALEAGVDLTVNVTANSDFYGEYWCTGAPWGNQPETGGPGRPCGASAPIGIVDYGHRPTPDVYFGRALETDGDWNSSNYASPEFDRLFAEYQAAIDVDGQKAAVGQIQQHLHDEAPALYPFFFDYLSGHDESVSGVQVTALGHMKLEKATIAQ
ncbi:MAG TPA: ABC transporter substrate-binding protein [Acidimicrobiia bacterium]|jgi:peptide/nickel transport system substrate-binding protein|nr:ABC transporter substrate-binding protein [Acidimicrobiia bacterium]